MSDALRSSIGKGFKKLRYLSPALFGAVCTGQPINERPLIMQGGKVWITTSEAKSLPTPWAKAEREGDEAWQKRIEARSIWQIEEVPRVTIDRVSAASAYYEVGRVVYGQECGLALLVNFADPASKSAFEQLLTLLGENGLGGRRSSGYGAFAWKKQQPLDLKLASGSRSILLSRYIPQGAEFEALQNEGSSYQLVDVGGWLYSIGTAAQRRQRIRMVAEGSVIAMTAAHLRGDIVDVRPDYRKSRQAHPIFGKGQGTAHPVYRSGLALALPIPDTQEANNG
jgi:CRISPR-associated protein Csm4